MLARSRPPWFLPEGSATPEAVFQDRRRFLARLGLVSIGAGLLRSSALAVGTRPPAKASGAARAVPTADLYPARRNPDYFRNWNPTTNQ